MGQNQRLALSVAAAALGYFVDLYDIVLFGVVRVASLTDIGVAGDETQQGVAMDVVHQAVCDIR